MNCDDSGILQLLSADWLCELQTNASVSAPVQNHDNNGTYLPSHCENYIYLKRCEVPGLRLYETPKRQKKMHKKVFI